MQFIDLHTHSQASDGTDSPGQLVRNAQIQGLAAVAVTDHDTVSGLDEAEAAARDLGLEFVRGCELSTSTELGEMHVLGLWLPRDLAPLQDRLQYLRRKRSERNVRIVEKLQGLGVEIELDEVLHEARGESVGRPHIAAVLVRKGYVKDVSEAITDYEVVERFGKYTLVRCKLRTGRTHQIRVHMEYLGYPLVGDPKYSPMKTPFAIKGQALHSQTLEFTHPRTGERLCFEAPLPEDMHKIITRLHLGQFN